MGFPAKVREVYPLDNLILKVVFQNGVEKKYDVKQLFTQFDMYKELENNPSLWKNVEVICGGSGIAWNDDIDISEYGLFRRHRKKQLQNMKNVIMTKFY